MTGGQYVMWEKEIEQKKLGKNKKKYSHKVKGYDDKLQPFERTVHRGFKDVANESTISVISTSPAHFSHTATGCTHTNSWGLWWARKLPAGLGLICTQFASELNVGSGKGHCEVFIKVR